MAQRRNLDSDALASPGARRIDPAWHSAQAGDRVRVTFPDGAGLDATIDDRTDDSAVVWIVVDGHGRRMIHPGDGLAVAPA